MPGLLEQLLERNRGTAQPFPARRAARVCVVTCDDASLTGRLDDALGLRDSGTVVVRLPGGGSGLSAELLQRAVLKSVLVDGCDEVVVLGHSACTLADLTGAALIAGLSRHGISRSAIPTDLRTFIGASRHPRELLSDAADALRRCAFLPANLVVHVARLDEATGKLEVVEHGASKVVARPSDEGERQIAGYVPGPTRFSEPEPSPPLSTPAPTLALDAAVPTAAPVETASSPVTAAPPKLPQGGRSSQGKKKTPPPPGEASQPGPSLKKALAKVRAFVSNEVQPPDRARTLAEVTAAMQRGASSEELVTIGMQPVLATGDARYRVINELLQVKEALGALDPDETVAALQKLLG